MRPIVAGFPLFVFWLVLVGPLSWLELLAGLLAAAVAVAALELVRRRANAPRADVPGLGELSALPLTVVRDFGKLALDLPRSPHRVGRYEERERRRGDALAFLVGSAAPNEVVVEVDADRDRQTVHRLLP